MQEELITHQLDYSVRELAAAARRRRVVLAQNHELADHNFAPQVVRGLRGPTSGRGVRRRLGCCVTIIIVEASLARLDVMG